MKVNIDIEISEETKRFFIDNGVKEEDFGSFIKELLMNGINQMLAKLPEILLAMKSDAVPSSAIAKELYTSGTELGQKLEEKYPKKKKDATSG